jgi:hypothetical protein
MKKTWRIPVVWSMKGIVSVEAESLADALELARDDAGVIPLPENGEFLDDSWEVDCFDEEYIRQCFNDNQED